MLKEYKVLEKTDLTTFLLGLNLTKKEVKRLLVNEKVYVNSKITTKYNFEIGKKDTVIINLNKSDLIVLYEDKDILLVDKPHGLLCVATETTKNTLYQRVSEYVKIKGKNNKIFIVNRLDRETSGIVMFAKSESIKHKLQNNWESVERKYLAKVIGKPKDSGVIKSFLQEDETYYVRSAKKGKLAITEYTKIDEKNGYSTLEINIKTGRKNQIRVHMKDIGCVIKGDVKYGAEKAKRMFLHAYQIKFNHPVTGKEKIIKAIIPRDFM